jgi:putative hydrolase of the HAD superfamily
MHGGDQLSGGASRPPRALLIDGLGTLVALAPPAPALRHELAARFGIEVSEAQAGHALGAEIAFYRAHMGLGRDADSLAALRHRCAEVLRGALAAGTGHEPLATLPIPAMADALLAALRFEPFGDAREALRAARSAGARVIVVSNWDVSLLEVLEVTGLSPLIDGAVTSAAIGAAKPAPAIFRHALALAGVAPDEAVHVGDNLAEDVAGARDSGIPAVLLDRDGTPPPGPPFDGVRVIATLAELRWP